MQNVAGPTRKETTYGMKKQAVRKMNGYQAIHPIKQKIHSTQSVHNSGPEFFTLTALVNNRPIKFMIDSGSPVTLIPKSQFNNITPLQPLETEYRDVNDNRIKVERKTTAMVKINGEQKHLEVLVTTKKTDPLLGLDWIKKLGSQQ